MIERMIDADVLDKLLEWLDKNFEYCKDIHNIEKKVVSYRFLLKKINELTTSAPKLQESIFDADGRCGDVSAAEALAFAKGEPNDCVVYRDVEPINTDTECQVIPVHDVGGNNV